MTTQEQSVRDVLVEAKRLIDTPEKWTTGTMQRGGRRCALGACVAIGGTGAAQPLYALLGQDDTYGTLSLVDFNDTHTHAEVMALFDRAIAAAS